MPGSRPRFPHERQQQMIEVIRERRHVGTAELAGLLDISLPTVRRDLTILEKAGIVSRTHGGVVAKEATGVAPEPLLLEKLRHNQGAKRRIGAEAASRVNDGQIVLLDAGTTALAVAQALAGRRVTVVALDLKVAEAAAVGRTDVLVVGGQVRNGYYSLTGTWARQTLASLRADIYFLGADGVAGTSLSATTFDDAEIKRVAMECCERTIAVVDHTKFATRSVAEVCDLGSLDELISDRDLGILPPAMMERIVRLTRA
ncbi:DeoR/GlpR family DNA-binding transcription regulator [Stappia sp.]|uniref:DeoR/GlpR family DNA-binding transcription regulator n=1 Tax=Stappia sp. TaxID=1870903 RepID=UPI0025E39141|nr:DeoR/GlpR family DNA-binding transcription regulator [Stappia sp.]